MKRVRCPKCDHYITFDETQYEDGQSLVFECPECRKQFGIRIGASKLRATRKEETVDENENDDAYGSIVVVENVFHYKQAASAECWRQRNRKVRERDCHFYPHPRQ